MGPMWLPYNFCPLYIYRVSQYAWDPFDCPIISAHCIYTGCLNMHGTHLTAPSFLPTVYIPGVSICMGPIWLPHHFCPLYIYRVSQYTWDLFDCPIISARCIYTGCLNIHGTHLTAPSFLPTVYIPGVSIYMGPIWLPHHFCPLYIYRVSQYTWDLFDCPIISAHCIYTGCLNMHGTHLTANNSNNNNAFFFVSDFKIVYYYNY